MQEFYDAVLEATDLPPELVIQILDLACIWLSTGESADIANPIRCASEGYPINRTRALSAIGAKRLRQAIFRITSRDQGWSSDIQHRGTFEHSWSWFEARLVDSTTGESSTEYEVQRNRHAGQDFEHHMAVLHPEHEMIQQVRAGNYIQLWMCARYPGWQNRVTSATIELKFFNAFQDDQKLLFVVEQDEEEDLENEEKMIKLQS